jgi:hypothetical protein
VLLDIIAQMALNINVILVIFLFLVQQAVLHLVLQDILVVILRTPWVNLVFRHNVLQELILLAGH